MSKIYRKVALARLSSPEQLDQLMQVTNPQGWLALVMVLVLLSATLAWSVLGAIPTEVTGRGMLLRHGGVSEVVAVGSGQVEEMLVSVGDFLDKGQAVARVRQEAVLRQIADSEAKRAELEEEYRSFVAYSEEQRRLSAASLRQQQANLERAIATHERQLELLQERIRVQSDLLADGLVTQQTVLGLEQEVNTTRDLLAAARLEYNGLDLRRLEAEQQLGQELEARRGVLRDLEIALAELRASLEENVVILSSAAGRILELLVDRGDVVSPGEPVLSMEVVSEQLVAVVFVPAALGKQVQHGMEARIVPSTVRREEYGFMLGEVSRVSEFPITSRGMQRLLANQELVAGLMDAGPLIQIDVALETDAATPSRFRWSSSKGPDLAITSGTLASGSIIVKRDRPLALAIPKMRKALGV